MDPINIIAEFYDPDSKGYRLLVQHGRQVAGKALTIALKMPHCNPDLNFIQEAAMLHDIGVFMTHSPDLGYNGGYPYVCHGYLGRKILEEWGLPLHALVCERHVGVGITAEEIKQHHLPLPVRDMVPVSIEEKIICFADKFFSKNGNMDAKEKSTEEILSNLKRYGHDKVECFQEWIQMFM
ncbi:MAG: HD domain-containing protein [Desulfobacterales bacterium]|nr:MAG: HD domain-containing protein [Desulfobacterales bacterium]